MPAPGTSVPTIPDAPLQWRRSAGWHAAVADDRLTCTMAASSRTTDQQRRPEPMSSGAPTASPIPGATVEEPAWVDAVWSVFTSLGLQQLAYVPDAGLAGLIRRAEAAWLEPAGPAPSARTGAAVGGPAAPPPGSGRRTPTSGDARSVSVGGMRAVPLSTEEEGVALLAGAWLGGQRGALLMQSSGVGNCINMLSLTQTCRIPLLVVVTMRGQWGERNPWQVPMGSTVATMLRAAGLLVFDVDSPDEVAPTVAAAGGMVFTGPAAAAVLISQRVLGAKAFNTARIAAPTAAPSAAPTTNGAGR